MLHYLGTYEGRIKIFLVLLVVFLAAAVTVNFCLLMMSRNAVREEIGQRIVLVAEAARIELRLGEGPLPGEGLEGSGASVGQSRLARLTKEHDLAAAELLDPAGIVLASSLVGRIGAHEREFAALGASLRRKLEAGTSVLAPLRDREGTAYATLSGFLPILDPSGKVRALLRVEEHAGDLARLDRSLKMLAGIQASGLSCLVLLVLLFARWLLAPYRKLMATAVGAGGDAAVRAAGGTPEPDALLNTFQAVVEKLRTQEMELQRLKGERSEGAGEEFPAEGLAASLNSGMVGFDQDGVLRLVNPAALQILGRRREEMVGKRLEALFGREEGLGKLLAEGLQEGQPRSREMVPYRRPDGREIHLGLGLSPIREGGGGTKGVICLLSDLTEIRQLRDRVALKENLAQLGELSAGIAHEFRNSLATLQGYARLLKRSRDEEARELAESVLREVGSITKVVGEFLQFARPAALNVREVDLKVLLLDLALEMAEPHSASPFTIRLTGDLPRLFGDEALLRRAFHNLFQNSAQARNGRGVVVEVTGYLEEGRALRLEVEDNGPGIAPGVLRKIFTPFFTTRSDGTGLGLPLVQKAIVSHDGSIEVASQIGLGTRFTIRLPLAGPPDAPLTAPSPP